MTLITEEMTPAQFFTALNSDFNSLGISEGIDDAITTIDGTKSYTVIENNMDLLDAAAPISVTIPIYAGMSGAAYISAINNNFNNLQTSVDTIFTQSNTIYVSNLGNDLTGDGTITKPYATLVKASTLLTDNTKVLIAKGSTFINDKLDLSNKYNVFVDSYGSGNVPILTGLKTVTEWTDEGGNIWSKQDDDFPIEITNVFLGETKATLARKAMSTATAGSNTTLTDSELVDADGFWDNAELYVVYYSYMFGVSRIVSYVDKTFTIPTLDLTSEGGEGTLIFPVKIGDQYYIQNHRECLTTQNQWAYNNSTKTLYIYSVSEPANVTASYGDDCIYGTEIKIVTIKNLTIDGADRCGININNSKYVNIKDITSNYSGYYSIIVHNSQVVTVDGNVLTDQNSDGIIILNCNKATIQNNVIDKSGYIIGQERYMDRVCPAQNGVGLWINNSRNAEVFYNEIYNTGYMGICCVYLTTYLIQYNYVHHVLLNFYKTGSLDGGAIYASYSTLGEIFNNIITDGHLHSLVPGIYMDIESHYNEIANNFITGYYSCIQNDLNHDNNYHDNTLFSVDSTENIRFYLINTEDTNTIINNNLLIAKLSSTISINIKNDSAIAATISNNKYYYPFGKTGTGNDNTMFKIVDDWKTLAEWKTDDERIDWDRDNETEITPSLYEGSEKPEEDFLIYLTNPAKTARTVEAEDLSYTDYIDMDGAEQSYPFTIQPYGSKILVRPN